MDETKANGFDILAHIGSIPSENGCTKEANIVSWSGRIPVLDIRDFKVGKNGIKHPLNGITFSMDELNYLINVLNNTNLESK